MSDVKEELKAFQDFLEEMKEKKKEENERNLFSAHYGIKDKDFKMSIGEMMGEIMSCKAKNEILDKHFPKLDEIGRAKVEAYAIAKTMLEDMKRAHR